MALGRAALKNRIRTITDARIELTDSQLAGPVLGAVVDGVAYCQTADVRGLGPLLRWAATNNADSMTVVAESDAAGVIARRAELVSMDISVWSAVGPEVTPAVAAPPLTPPKLADTHHRYAQVIAEAGARVIDDHGMLVAEVAGLEVARVVEEDGVTKLSVGVGQADRELQEYIHGHLDDDANLRRAIAAVVEHRRPGSATHPLTRVARQRWLRSILFDDPSLVGLSHLEPTIPLRPRTTVLGSEPSAAATPGTLVVCSVGVDLDLLTEAADYRLRDDPSAEIIAVVPERDLQLVTGPVVDLIPRLRVLSIPEPWA